MSNSIRERLFRCRKCRSVVLTGKTDGNEENEACCETFSELAPILVDEEIPDWLTTAFNEGDWRKGKLRCPTCKAKLGAFTFVSSQPCYCGRRRSPSVYLHKRKVDVSAVTKRLDQKTAYNLAGDPNNATSSVLSDRLSQRFPAASSTLAGSRAKSHRKSQSWHAPSSVVSTWLASTFAEVSSHLDVAVAETKHVLAGTLNLAGNVAAPVQSAIKKGHRKTKSWSGSIKTTLATLLGGIFPDSRTTRPASTVNIHPPQTTHNAPASRTVSSIETRENFTAATDTGENSAVMTENNVDSTSVAVVSECEDQTKSEQTQTTPPVPDSLLCSVCLDMLCLPRCCVPCRHIFCEPCLKLLVHNLPAPRTPLRTSCPLCRQLIRWTEPATDIRSVLLGPNFALRYTNRVEDYQKQGKVHSLALPGLYQLKLVRDIMSGLPDGISNHLETFWINYTPLITLYSFFVTLLCLLFFFTLFLPGVYFTSWIWKMVTNFSFSLEMGVMGVYQEALDIGVLLVSSGSLSLFSIVVFVSIALYALFIM